MGTELRAKTGFHGFEKDQGGVESTPPGAQSAQWVLFDSWLGTVSTGWVFG